MHTCQEVISCRGAGIKYVTLAQQCAHPTKDPFPISFRTLNEPEQWALTIGGCSCSCSRPAWIIAIGDPEMNVTLSPWARCSFPGTRQGSPSQFYGQQLVLSSFLRSPAGYTASNWNASSQILFLADLEGKVEAGRGLKSVRMCHYVFGKYFQYFRFIFGSFLIEGSFF